MALNKYESCLFLALKTCQNPNLGDAQLRNISFAAKNPSHQSRKLKKLDIVFKIQAIGCYSFQTSNMFLFQQGWNHQFCLLILIQRRNQLYSRIFNYIQTTHHLSLNKFHNQMRKGSQFCHHQKDVFRSQPFTTKNA